ncbi:MAG: phosphoribosylglycinamide formyltransferase [Halieaceae bacterium]|nr:phosphoribosylglycinamide formyltransferase [Halieaceae bacterium]
MNNPERTLSRPRIAVLASGDGSNMQALAAACADGRIAADMALVLANRPDAGVRRRADALAIPQACVDHRQFASRGDFDKELHRRLQQAGIDLVVLAGFMRILSEGFVRQYCGSLLNIHPSLLPKYPGLNTHQRALDSGDRETGATVHFVVPELDAGPSIIQAAVPVLPRDDAQRLAQRVRIAEHRIYPRAVHWWVEGRLALRDGKAWLDGEAIVDALQNDCRID